MAIYKKTSFYITEQANLSYKLLILNTMKRYTILLLIFSPAGASVSLVNTNKIGKVSKSQILKFALTTPRIKISKPHSKNTVKKTPKHRNVIEFLKSKLHGNI